MGLSKWTWLKEVVRRKAFESIGLHTWKKCWWARCCENMAKIAHIMKHVEWIWWNMVFWLHCESLTWKCVVWREHGIGSEQNVWKTLNGVWKIVDSVLIIVMWSLVFVIVWSEEKIHSAVCGMNMAKCGVLVVLWVINVEVHCVMRAWQRQWTRFLKNYWRCFDSCCMKFNVFLLAKCFKSMVFFHIRIFLFEIICNLKLKLKSFKCHQKIQKKKGGRYSNIFMCFVDYLKLHEIFFIIYLCTLK